MSGLLCPECAACPHYLAHKAPPSGLVLTDGLRALWHGSDVSLTFGEVRILKRLVEANGDFVSCRALYDVLQSPGFSAGYGGTGVCGNVRSAIKRLRGKFRKVDPAFNAIRTYSGVGYAWRVTP
jgi:two-component system response regulator ChvI